MEKYKIYLFLSKKGINGELKPHHIEVFSGNSEEVSREIQPILISLNSRNPILALLDDKYNAIRFKDVMDTISMNKEEVCSLLRPYDIINIVMKDNNDKIWNSAFQAQFNTLDEFLKKNVSDQKMFIYRSIIPFCDPESINFHIDLTVKYNYGEEGGGARNVEAFQRAYKKDGNVETLFKELGLGLAEGIVGRVLGGFREDPIGKVAVDVAESVIGMNVERSFTEEVKKSIELENIELK
nr:818_t:CDS:2 [Entrophospora candida]